MTASLSFEEIIFNNYTTEDSGVVLTPAIQSLLIAAITLLSTPDVWSDFDTWSDEIDALLADAQEAVLDTEIPPPVTLITRADIWNRFSAISGGTLTRTLNNFMTFGYVMQSDTTASRMMTDVVYLSSGTWEYRGLYAKSSDAGINFVTLTPVAGGFINLVDNLDQFGLFNAEFLATTTFELDEPGLFTLQTKNTGSKNASSSGYRVNWTSHHFWRTGD